MKSKYKNIYYAIAEIMELEKETTAKDLFIKGPLSDFMSYRTFYRVVEHLTIDNIIESKKIGGRAKGMKTLILSVDKPKLEGKLEEIRSVLIKKEEKSAKRKV